VEGLNALAACAAFHEWRLTEAEELFLRAIAVNPNYVLTYMWYGQLLENTGRQEANVETRAVAVRLDPLNLRAGAALGIALFLEERAQTEYVSPFRVALVHVGLGDVDAALCSLERAFEIRAVDLSEVKVDPRFAPLAGEPRFVALLQKMGLTG
jgi:tetratricopeptide (TPR) repeat protein